GAALGGGGGAGCCHREIGGQCECLDALARGAVELVDVRTVFVGNKDALAVIGSAHAFRVEAGIVGVAGRSGAKAVRAACEIVGAVEGVQGGHAAAQRVGGICSQRAGAIGQRRGAGQERGCLQRRGERVRQRSRRSGRQIQLERLEAGNVRRGIVNQRIVRSCIGSAVRGCD